MTNPLFLHLISHQHVGHPHLWPRYPLRMKPPGSILKDLRGHGMHWKLESWKVVCLWSRILDTQYLWISQTCLIWCTNIAQFDIVVRCCRIFCISKTLNKHVHSLHKSPLRRCLRDSKAECCGKRGLLSLRLHGYLLVQCLMILIHPEIRPYFGQPCVFWRYTSSCNGSSSHFPLYDLIHHVRRVVWVPPVLYVRWWEDDFCPMVYYPYSIILLQLFTANICKYLRIGLPK